MISRKSFTMIEILAAMGIFLIGVMPVMYSFVRGTASFTENRQKLEASNLLRNVIRELRFCPASGHPLIYRDSNSDYSGPGTAVTEPPTNGVSYNMVFDSGLSQAQANANGHSNYVDDGSGPGFDSDDIIDYFGPSVADKRHVLYGHEGFRYIVLMSSDNSAGPGMRRVVIWIYWGLNRVNGNDRLGNFGTISLAGIKDEQRPNYGPNLTFRCALPNVVNPN